jgi:hypothetical protein
MTAAVPDILRTEALGLLEGRSMLLDLARELSRWMREGGVPGAVIGGVAVVLHGHVRTTTDLDVFVGDSPEPVAALLLARGFTFDASSREFLRDGIPVHLVTLRQIGNPPRRLVEIDGVTTVSLEDLLEMKLRSGTANLLRAQDLADAIGLIRRHRLSSEFARHLDKDLRPSYRRLVKELKREADEST